MRYLKYVKKKKSKKFTVSVPEAYSDYGKVYIGTDESLTSGTFKYGDEVTLTAKAAKENYKFAGWYTDSNCTGDPIKDSENNVVGENYTFTVDKSTVNYYAKFEIKTKTISVHCKEGTDDTTSSVKIMLGNVDKGASGTFNYGETIKLVASPASNYEVEAWYMDANCSQKVLSSEGKTELLLTVGDSTSETYYVKFKQRNITLYLTDNKGWGNIECHAWVDGTDDNNGWVSMTYDSQNSQKQNIYKVTILSKYNRVMFRKTNDDNAKTVDISGFSDNSKYWVSGNSNPYAVTSW